jgi:hypothetical protein
MNTLLSEVLGNKLLMDKLVGMVIEPLGIAGIALFLVFFYLAVLKRDKAVVLCVFLLVAVTALVGGLGLSYSKVSSRMDAKAGVNGNVTINAGETEKKDTEKKR